ncbi:MAG: choice-of-anchor D domain-containing protein, partial [Verrucomicrobia bacterium]|nr:choice-of-anchor D domain-containing protein [Verrucomicrobiota bacterium]
VLALAHDGTNLYAGGEFTTAGGVAANFVAKWDPASGTWTNLGSGMNENVYALTHDGPNLYAGGNFTTAGGVAANKVAKWGPTYIEISGVEPSSGSTTGGYQVVISGLDLGDGSDITNVTLCGVSVASIQSQSSTQVVVVAGAGGPGIGDVRVFSTSFGETVKSNAFTYLMPQFLLLGTNGMEIVNGEAASAAKGMDFGILPWGQALTNQFAITNAGDAELTISGWTTNGTGADAFSILDMPSVVSASSAVQFRAVFSPATAGAFTCTVSIVNDSTNTPYLLNLRGSAYSLSTNIGPYAGGNMITITNGDFGTITNVTVGGVNATIQGSGASWVTITLPAAGSAGVKDIVIQTSDNGDITLAGAYTYNAAGEIIAIYYDTNQWTEVAGLPEERRDLAAGVLDGALYALGGWDGTTPYTNMWRYDGTTWTEVTGLSTARYGLAAGVLNGSLYAIGGVDSAVRTNVYRYDGTNWTEVAGLPLARRDLAAGVLNGALYALGGFSGTYRTNMWRYDGTNWTQVAGLPAARRDLAAGVLDGALYALGGYDGSYQTNVWRYDGTNWAEVASLPEARRNLAADVWNGALYAIGGRDGAVQTNVYRYDGTNWTEVAGLLARRDELAAGMLDDVLYAIGGRFGSARTNVYRYPGRLDLGVNPSSGSYTGGYTVVLTGTDLGDGADVTNVTLCGVSVTSIDSQSATQVIVTAGPSAAGELGDVRVFSTSFGETVKSNAFTYLMPQFIFLGTNGAVIANGAAASTEAGTDYGALIVGLAVTNTFGITNSGNADLIISGVTSSGTGSASFELVDPIAVTFPVTNPAGNLAYLQVAFRPQSGGSQPAEFTVYHNGTNSPFVVNLAGFGLGGGIALETNELAFSGTYGGASPADQYLLVSNVGVSGFTYTNVVTYSAGASGWLAVGPAAGTVALAGSANLTNAVDIAGVNAGTYYATNAMIAAEATNSPQVYVVTLTVNKADQAITDFLPTNGSAFVTTDAVGLAASASSGLPVSFATNGGPAVIAGGTNLSFTGTGSVSIVASQAGDANWNPAPDVTNTFIVTEVPTVLMAVLGTNGAEVASGEAASAAKGTDFGAVGWGRAVTNVLAVTNNGTALLSITAVTTNGDGAAEFEVRDLPFDVSPGAASNFAVVFTPVLGLSTAVVSLANTSTNDPFELRLAGSGFAYTTTVVTAYGVANPGTTSTAYGVSLDEWIEGSPVEAGGTQIVCAAATVAGNDYTQVTPTNISLTVTNHSLVTWQWTTNVQFTVSAGPNGSVTGDPSGWSPLGGSVTVTAVPDVTYYFDSWTGDVPAGQTNQNPLALTMDRVRSITANFSTNPPSIGTHYVVLNNPGAAYPYTSWATAASNIQDAIDAAAPGETVLVSNGVYNTGGRAGSVSNRVIIAEGVTLESVGGPSVTFIVGEGPCGENAVRCVKMGTNSALIGFTLTNGHTWVTGTASLVRSGGGVWCDTGAVVSNCVITGNRAQYYGGGAYRGTLLDCVFTANECTNYGGGAYRSTVVGGVFSNNASADDGGGAHGGTLAGCLFTGNRAKDKGGGVCSASLTNCVFTDNYCANNGGGAANSRLDTCTLSGNEAFDVGGGAYGGTLTNCVLEGNSAGYAGGGAAYSTLLALCTVSNNVAGQYGGGAHQSTLRYCAVVDNVSSNYGGGTSDSTLTGCRVTGNDGGWGGGTYQGTVYSSTNDGNTAQIGGGAFQSSMYSCLLTNNQAVTGGGAYGGSLRNCVLAGNQATSGGGAYDSTLRWCRLTDNVADGRGGGANLGTLYNCLLTGNLAGTGGATRASMLYNCTLAANTASS